MGTKGVHYVDQLLNGAGLDIYRDGTHMVRISNAGTVHVYYGNVLVHRGGAEIKGDVHITGNLDVKGDLYVEGSISTKNGCIIGGNLEVGGDTLLHGNLTQDAAGAAVINMPDNPHPPPVSVPPLGDFPSLEDKPSI